MKAQVSVVGLDIAKSVFQVHGADSAGKAVIRRKLKREEVEVFFRALPRSLVALEACPGSHFWARLLRDIGHDVRLIPAQYVRPYVKTNKNDAADAEAICVSGRCGPRTGYLDGVKFHGSRSSRRLCGWSLASAVRVALR